MKPVCNLTLFAILESLNQNTVILIDDSSWMIHSSTFPQPNLSVRPCWTPYFLFPSLVTFTVTVWPFGALWDSIFNLKLMNSVEVLEDLLLRQSQWWNASVLSCGISLFYLPSLYWWGSDYGGHFRSIPFEPYKAIVLNQCLCVHMHKPVSWPSLIDRSPVTFSVCLK